VSGRQGRKRPYQLVEDIVSVGAQALMEQLSVPDEQAKELMRQIAHEVCFRNARCLIYVPEALDFMLTKRDEDIWAEYQLDGPSGARKFSAARVEQLAEQHRLTSTQIYNIVRLMKKREINARQATIPGLEPA